MFTFFKKKKRVRGAVPVTYQLMFRTATEFLPVYKHSYDAGADVKAFRTKNLGKYITSLSEPQFDMDFFHDGYNLQPGETKLFGCGFACQLPPGFAFLVCPRSGLAAKNSITVLNAPGICDAGYLGEYGVILHNAGNEPFRISYGDRIAQIVLVRTRQATFVEGGFTTTDSRGTGGFGSTGVK